MKLDLKTQPSILFIGLAALLALTTTSLAQRGRGGGGFGLDPRVEGRTYHFADTDEDLPYCVFASSKISEDTSAPLIISLHGLGAGPQIMCNTTAVDLAEEGGYVLAAPMGYNTGGWYGSPVLGGGGARGRGRGADDQADAGRGARGRGFGGGNQPDNLAELSEKDVMNVLAMVREEFNIDDDRIYLTGHSMGGAGAYFLGSKHAELWAAIAPVAPAAFSMMQNRAEYLQPIKDAGVPIMVVHGDEDEAVPVQTSRDWVATMEELGIEHEYVELPGVTHGPVITASQEYVYKFFGEHTR
jgi:poly(3-hydroxybutyrate) depolymerase